MKKIAHWWIQGSMYVMETPDNGDGERRFFFHMSTEGWQKMSDFAIKFGYKLHRC